MFSLRAIRALALLILALLLAALTFRRDADVGLWLVIFSVFTCSLIEFCAIHEEKRLPEQKTPEKLGQERLARLESRLLAGELVRLEEWWEDDDLLIDENAHILFVFRDGEEMDFVLYNDVAAEISRLLAALGISWQASFRLKADSRVIWQKC